MFKIIYLQSGDAYTATRRLTMTVTDQTDTAVDLSGTDLIFRIESSTGDVLITKTTDDAAEIEVAAPQSGATLGVCYVALDEADTDDMAGRYLWELEGTDAGGSMTLGYGAVYIKGDIILNAAS
ncbi:MAG: hypothetical protein EHM89_15970 [Acidobacteria bacterium]|nr:MAG: hypothetical protein EHM89_15970 [Acidobacteriota bacterium]